MKKRESKEPDFFVVNKKLTEKEKKEISDYINDYKEKRKKAKHKKAA